MTPRKPTLLPAPLRTPLLVCLATLTAAAALVITSNHIRADADDTHKNLTLRLTSIHHQHEEAQKASADARLALRQHAELERLGLTSAAPRLQLASAIDAALNETDLADLHYALSPRQPLDDTSLLGLTTIRLDGSIPHEARLLALLKQLETTASGLFIPLRCSIARTTIDAHTIVKADCEAAWLALQPPA